MSITHKSSKVVYLRRAPMSIPEATGGTDLKEYFDNAYRSVGSYWTKGSMRVATGLTIAEENLLMPLIINIPKEDRDFRAKVTDFFHDISTKAEPTNLKGEGGTKLEIGLANNEEDLSEDNMPLNVSDYVRYRHAMGHPEVALSEELAKGNQLKAYFIYNPVDVLNSNVGKADLKDEALGAYLVVKQSPAKVIQYLTLLNINSSLFRGQEAVKLREIAEKQSKDFLAVHNDTDKNARYLIKDLIAANVLEELGSRIMIKETQFQIGGTEKEAIAYMKDPENSKQLTIFKAQVQDWRKKKSPTLADIEADGSPAETSTTA